MDSRAALHALEWQIDLGADEAICDAPVNRFTVVERPKPAAPAAKPAAPEPPPPAAAVDPVAVARAAASSAQDLGALQAALAAYEHCELKKGARNLVFSDGAPGARVMVVGEAPGRDEDLQGRPFVGAAGQLLDKMFAAIGLSRSAANLPDALYITNVMPWRPPQNRNPEPEAIAMMVPFLERHIALAAPQVVVAMGNIAAQALIGRKGILRLRGNWDSAFGLPVLPMTHPAYLLRTPEAKREAWADLQSLKAHLLDNPR